MTRHDRHCTYAFTPIAIHLWTNIRKTLTTILSRKIACHRQTKRTTTTTKKDRILLPRAPPYPYLRLLSLQERRSECVDRIPGSTLVVRCWLREGGASRPSQLSSRLDLLRSFSVFRGRDSLVLFSVFLFSLFRRRLGFSRGTEKERGIEAAINPDVFRYPGACGTASVGVERHVTERCRAMQFPRSYGRKHNLANKVILKSLVLIPWSDFIPEALDVNK